MISIFGVLYRLSRIINLSKSTWMICFFYFRNRKLFEKINNISQATGSKSTDFWSKAYEIRKLVNRHVQANSDRELLIVEIGTGRSSLVFMDVVANCRNRGINIRYLGLEQNEEWYALVSKELDRTSDNVSKLVVSPVIKIPNVGGRLKVDIPSMASFVYIDGPAVEGENGKYRLPGGAPLYVDFQDHFRRGGRPDIVVVDGRRFTVEDIERTVGRDYRVSLDVGNSLLRRDVRQLLGWRRHTLFKLENSNVT